MSPRASRLAPDERRRAIVDVVVPLLLERGSKVTTREIAEAAGIAEGTIFRVFPDLAALWAAVADVTLDPAVELSELHAALAGREGLRDQVVGVAEHLFARSQKVTAVMMAMRSVMMSCPPSGNADQPSAGKDGERSPFAFMQAANEALMTGLADLFEPHRDELTVDPATAATILRALVLGTRHPGAVSPVTLTPEIVADVLLHGVGRDDKVGRG